MYCVGSLQVCQDHFDLLSDELSVICLQFVQ